MARPLRLELAGGLYHVTSRGNGRQAIYLDDEDRKDWLGIVEAVCSRFNWACHAYCLMSNHYHLVIETVEGNLSRGMRQLNGVYTQNFNRRHGRVGHLYQGRYQAILVERHSYLLALSRYVVLNPVRAKLVKDAADWEWSSYRAMMGQVAAPQWLQIHWVLGQFSRNQSLAMARYQDYVRAGVGLPSVWGQLNNQIYLGDESFVRLMQSKITHNASRLTEIPRKQRRSMAKPLDFYVNNFDNAKQGMREAYAGGEYTMQQIADAFGVHYSTVRRAVNLIHA